MDITQQHRNNYFRLVAVIVDVAYLVISKYIKEKILGSDSFETFLNKEKHKLVHIYETSQCCECGIPSIKKEKLITRKQLLILYKSDKRNQIRDHKKYVRNKLTQICICEYSAKAHIDVRVVDITLANYIIQKCGKHELGIDNWIKQIKDVRNEIFHLSDIQEMTDQIFSITWTKLERSIMGIAKVISNDYGEEADKHIMQTKKLIIIDDYMLKYEIICRDYWRNKCAEFERAQNQVIEEKAAALHHTMPHRFSRSMEKDCQQTMRKIQTLDSMVDKINVMVNIFGCEENMELFDDTELVAADNKRILIPVFMQLDIPTSWDKTKVFDAIDECRITGTPDMNIRIKAISIDDLNMYAEIAKQVLGNVHQLRSEINKLMSTMLSDAEIDTMENAELCVNLNVPDRSAPRQFDIGECTDCSITIEWHINDQDDCLSYEIAHRPQRTKDWSTGTFLSEDVLKEEDGRRMYTLRNLLPETYYEFKLRYVYRDAKSHYSESKTKQTLKLENEPNKEVQDQTSVKTNRPVSVILRQQLNIKKSENEKLYISSCIKIGNTLVFTDILKIRLIICNSDGTDIHHIPLSYKPQYITQIDSKTVAVSCRNVYTILIINISTRSITSTINTYFNCLGISYNYDNLYVVITMSQIRVMDLKGEVIRTIPGPSQCIRDITVDRDKLICIDSTSIYCCSLDGKKTWEKKGAFHDLNGVTTDNEENVYVTNERTHTVIIVSDYGQHHRELLTKSDGLNEPFGIYFDKKENSLLVCNIYDGLVFLFDVKREAT